MSREDKTKNYKGNDGISKLKLHGSSFTPRPYEKDTFSCVTGNMFQALENYNQDFPDIINKEQTQTSYKAREFEQYRATAQARRRLGFDRNQQRSRNNSKRRRNTPNSSPKDKQQEKKLCTKDAMPTKEDFDRRREETKTRIGYKGHTGYQFKRQDRDYQKYEKKNDHKSKEAEIQNTSNTSASSTSTSSTVIEKSDNLIDISDMEVDLINNVKSSNETIELVGNTNVNTKEVST